MGQDTRIRSQHGIYITANGERAVYAWRRARQGKARPGGGIESDEGQDIYRRRCAVQSTSGVGTVTSVMSWGVYFLKVRLNFVSI